MALIQRRFFHDPDIDRLPLAPRPPFQFVGDGLPFAQHLTTLGGAAAKENVLCIVGGSFAADEDCSLWSLSGHGRSPFSVQYMARGGRGDAVCRRLIS